MHVFDDVTTCTCSLPGLVLTIGSFDGMHRGHQYILKTVIETARKAGGSAGLMSLWPHPRTLLHPEVAPELLTTPGEKRRLLEAIGLDAYFILPFNKSIAEMDRETFLRDIVIGKCGAQTLIVGHDFSFGAGARGDFAYLESVAAPLGLEVRQLPPLAEGSDRISSTLIRAEVNAGALERVHQLLGRPYTLTGPVVQGRGLGSGLGFPTANVAPPENMLPAFGIYAARVYWDDEEALGAVNIGLAPTLSHESPMVEVHLLDREVSLVGKTLRVALYHRLRGEKKFPDIDALKEAIKKDIVEIRRYFNATS